MKVDINYSIRTVRRYFERVTRMIVTSSKPYGIIRGQLTKRYKTGIVSCNSCVRVCETGGKQRMEELYTRLQKDGFKVVDMDLIPMACSIALVKKPSFDGSVLIVLACDAGVYTLEKLFPKKKVIAALDTTGLGARDEHGNIFLMRKF
jgi:hypothetical protein